LRCFDDRIQPNTFHLSTQLEQIIFASNIFRREIPIEPHSFPGFDHQDDYESSTFLRSTFVIA